MKAKLFAIAALAALGLTSPASATIVTLTYTGVVVDGGSTLSNGTDAQGLFGPAGASLVGDTYTASYVFDTSLGGSVYDMNTPTNLTMYGGADFPGTTSPALSASLTINGRTLSFGPAGTDGGMMLCGFPLGCSGASNSYDEVYAIDDALQQQLYAYAPSGPGIPVQSFDFSLVSTTPYQSRGDLNMSNEFLDLLPLSVTVSAIPEPATWTMMLVGFFGLGFAGLLRSRRVLIWRVVAPCRPYSSASKSETSLEAYPASLP